MVVGGYAVVAHGYMRFTGDLDIWIQVSEENATKMMSVVRDYPIPPGIFSKEHFMAEGPLKGVQFGNPPLRIDILNNIIGMTFNDCYERAYIKTVEDIECKFIDFNDLITAKEISGRPQDIADAKNLIKIKNRSNSKNKK